MEEGGLELSTFCTLGDHLTPGPRISAAKVLVGLSFIIYCHLSRTFIAIFGHNGAERGITIYAARLTFLASC